MAYDYLSSQPLYRILVIQRSWISHDVPKAVTIVEDSYWYLFLAIVLFYTWRPAEKDLEVKKEPI